MSVGATCVAKVIWFYFGTADCGPAAPNEAVPITFPTPQPYTVQATTTISGNAISTITLTVNPAILSAGLLSSVPAAVGITCTASVWTLTPTNFPCNPISTTAIGLSSTATAVGATTTTQTSVAQTSTTPNTAQTVEHNQKGLGSGAAAGVGIGSAIAGAAVALVIAFFCFGWRARRRNKDSGDRESSEEAVEPKTAAAAATFAIPKDSATAIVESNLPQPLQDNTIKNAFSKIGENIEGHILGFYKSSQGVDHRVAAHAILQAVGTEFPLSLLQTTKLLENVTTRPVVLRAGLGHIISNGMDMQGSASDSFLPPFVSTALQSMTLAKGKDSTGKTALFANQSSQIHRAFLSRWRTLSAFLFQGNFEQPNWTEADSRHQSVGNAVKLADSFLRLYATDPDSNSRHKNLELIIQRAARFSYTLFSQPSVWSFEWQTKPGELAVFPALLMKFDEDGAALSPPVTFVEGKTARI